VSRGGKDGWVYDPFNKTIRQEYYDCSALKSPDGDQKLIPFLVSSVASEGRGVVASAFHFDKEWCVYVYMHIHEYVRMVPCEEASG
jgi:hypothetical protein